MMLSRRSFIAVCLKAISALFVGVGLPSLVRSPTDEWTTEVGLELVHESVIDANSRQELLLLFPESPVTIATLLKEARERYEI